MSILSIFIILSRVCVCVCVRNFLSVLKCFSKMSDNWALANYYWQYKSILTVLFGEELFQSNIPP